MCYTQCGIGWSAQQTSVVPHSLYNQDQKYPVKVSGYTTHMHTECLMCVTLCLLYIRVYSTLVCCVVAVQQWCQRPTTFIPLTV